MKKTVAVILLIIVLAGSGYLWSQSRDRGLAQAAVETVPAERGDLTVTAEASGAVRANQASILIWQTTGVVEQVQVAVGDQVAKDQALASLDPRSLSQLVILAEAELVQAENELDNLLESKMQQAQAQQAVEAAQQALEDARNPELARGEALEAVAAADKALDAAQRQVDILKTPPSQSALDQTYANLLLAENVLNRTLQDIERVERRLKKKESDYMFWESRDLYRKLLESLELKRTRDQRSYEDALAKYNRLLAPPNPTDLAVAEANLEAARAQLAEAERAYERVKDGASPANLALLEAQLADAERAYERVKDGPDPDDIAAAEARVAAAQAAIDQTRLVAPFGGVVTAVESKVGDQVAPGTVAFRLDDLSQLLVDVQVSEVDVNRIQVGQPASLVFDAILNREYQGVVRDVALVGSVNEGVVDFTVTVELTDADASVKPGMTAAVNIVVNQLEDVLLVPNRAVRILESQRVVYLLQNGTLEPVEVMLGASSETMSEVLDGELQVGDSIVLNPPTEFDQGGPPFMR